MGNATKTITNIPKLKVGQHLFLSKTCYYLKVNSSNKNNFPLARKPNCQKLEN